jgi:uncharacterized protein
MSEEFANLWTLAAKQFRLGSNTLHGSDHWQRVERNALRIAPHSRANVQIVRLFAVLHDSQRMNESHDPEHGRRAAEWAGELRTREFELSDVAFDTLCQALIWHDKGQTSDDPTIGTCWDADRLDLIRIGVRPHVSFMSTVYEKSLAGESQA